MSRNFRFRRPFQNDAPWVLAVRLLGILGGVLVLRGSNAGRWLLILWMFYHVVLSFFHDLTGLIMHAVMLGLMVYIFFHRKVNTFFRKDKRKYP